MSQSKIRAAVPLLAAALGIGAAHAQDAPKRFPQITLEQMNAQQREVAEQILKISSIGLTGPYNPLLRSPVRAARWRAVFDYLRFNSSVPLRLNEFAILIQARALTAQVEWYAHAPMAQARGQRRLASIDTRSRSPGTVARVARAHRETA